MLARFKQEAYKHAHETWQKALHRAQRFVEQAKAWSRRVIDAAEESPASAWAKTQLVKRDPEQMQRVDQYRQAELAQRHGQLFACRHADPPLHVVLLPPDSPAGSNLREATSQHG